jgi:hypothetical protein
VIIRAFSFLSPTTLQTAVACVRALQLPSIETVVGRARTLFLHRTALPYPPTATRPAQTTTQNNILFVLVYTNIILCTQIKRAIVLKLVFVYTNPQKCNFCVHKYNFVYTNKTRNCFEIGICVHQSAKMQFLCTQI